MCMSNVPTVETVKVSLVQSTEMPKKKFIIAENMDINDMKGIENTIIDFILERVEVQYSFGSGINQVPSEASKDIMYVYCGARNLEVYVNGPSQVLALLIKQCALNGVKLKLIHKGAQNKWDVVQQIF